jgi:hypothetical protein
MMQIVFGGVLLIIAIMMIVQMLPRSVRKSLDNE